jgi:Flp pilus assembly protein TadB
VSAVLAALSGSVALALLLPLSARTDAGQAIARPERVIAERALLARLRVVLCALAVAAGWTVVGGVLGFGAGLVAAVLSWRALSRLESPATARRRRELERDLPVAVHLLAACLAAGAATTAALEAVSSAMPGAAGEELGLVHRRLHWGTDPASVWRSLEGPLGELGRRMARAHESGASVQHAVARLADELQNRARSDADSRARTVEVQASAPLGLCFLPSFVLLGVVPLAAGLFSSLSVFR